MVCLKCNLAADTVGYSFRIATTPTGDPFVEWSTERELRTAEEVMGISIDKRGSVDEAADWLEDILGAQPVATKRVRELAEKAGHAWRTVERARRQLEVIAERVSVGNSGTGAWQWQLASTPVPKNANPVSNGGGLVDVAENKGSETQEVQDRQTSTLRLAAKRPQGSQAADDGGVAEQLLLPKAPHKYPCLNCKGKGCRFCDPQLPRR